jgi:uncharacterized membrane protein
MTNILVANFNNDTTAIDALHKLYDLDRQDDIEVLDHVLLKRNTDGTFEYLKDEREPDGWATIGGMLLGGFIGLVGGPIGFVAGSFAGLSLGAVTDAFRYSFDYDFMENFKQGLPVGTTMLIAEVTEPSSVFVNDAFAPYGAKIWRSNIYTEQDKYFQAQIDVMNAEIDDAERDLEASAAADKAAIQAKITDLKARRDARVAEIKADMQDDVDSFKADIDRLQKKIQSKVDEVRQNRLEYKLAKNQEKIAKYEAQAAKLNAEMAKYSTAKQA